MASILMLYLDRKNEVSALRVEIEALKQEQELTQQNIAALTEKVESLEKTVSSQISMNVTALGTDIEALRRDQMIIRSEIEALASEVESLKKTRLEEEISPAEVKLDVPRYKQAHSLTCEASAASMVANFYGVPLSEEEIIEALPRDENPKLGFRGRPDGVPGGLTDYGVYAEPIREALAANGLEATYVDDLAEIKRALNRRHPVIAWVTYKLRVQQPVEITLSTGQEVKVVNYAHTVVVTGYNQEGFWVNDPYDGKEYFYNSTDLARAFGYLDNMALEVAP
ncbi:MAG: C39 family peptidase [Anaerolineales bacterium]|nr:C39 family peptidase [Anaerolineales bacterium]